MRDSKGSINVWLQALAALFGMKPPSPEKLNMEKSMEMSFFAWNMEMSFFACPYIFLMFAPKIGMNQTGIVLSSSGCNSSRFSGPCTRSYVKGIPKKDISMFLICIASL
jgi:hypothetical protein